MPSTMTISNSSSSFFLIFFSLVLLLLLASAGHVAASHHKKHDSSSGSGSRRGNQYDFFYFVLQWPGAYCDSRQGCCYPTSGKPSADFGIHGLWPNRNDGSYPTDCDSSQPFQESQVTDLLEDLRSSWPTLACPSNSGLRFWQHEWEKHGTCAETAFGDERGYFQAALGLKSQLSGLLGALQSAGIEPNDGEYSVESIKEAIKAGTGYTAFIECNKDAEGSNQLYQLYFCVDASGQQFIECPVLPHSRPCGSEIQFPYFGNGGGAAAVRDEL